MRLIDEWLATNVRTVRQSVVGKGSRRILGEWVVEKKT